MACDLGLSRVGGASRTLTPQAESGWVTVTIATLYHDTR
jgi:hypothetical protein